MLEKCNILEIVFFNLLLIVLWDIVILFFSVKISKKLLDPKRSLFKEKSWERNGKFYTQNLHINKWKDSLPQYIGKNGFSKRNLANPRHLSIEYLQEFILETCRAEWNHFMCCLFPLISFYVNSIYYATIFSALSIITNVPFILIQRYNRIRLTKLLNKKAKILS